MNKLIKYQGQPITQPHKRGRDTLDNAHYQSHTLLGANS